MPAKQGKSPKVRRAGKNRHVVANPKVVHRTGGRKPQPRQITSDDRIKGIRNCVRAGASEFLQFRKIEETAEMQIQIDFWTGQSDLELSRELPPGQLQVAQEAFVHGCILVPDSAFAFVDGKPALPGRGSEFFGHLMAKKEADRAAAMQRRKQQLTRGRKPASTASAT